ncbi:hypothetical protein ABEF93_001336 [Exophiala dermatitidis]
MNQQSFYGNSIFGQPAQVYPQARPYSLPFFFRIQDITHRQDPHSLPAGTDAGFYWSPPMKKDQFVRLHSHAWAAWDPHQHTYNPMHVVRPITPEENHRRVGHRTCTMFWAPDRHGYLVVPVNCLEIDLARSEYPWKRLSFGRCNRSANRHIALAGHDMAVYQLHEPGPDHWFEELLPVVCQPPISAPKTCTLAGELNVLVALVAFSANQANEVNAIRHSFRPDPSSTLFCPNRLPKAPKNFIRGMIVDIAFDPHRITQSHLKDWEDGCMGEIFR